MYICNINSSGLNLELQKLPRVKAMISNVMLNCYFVIIHRDVMREVMDPVYLEHDA